jgi:osmoprotectant transport system substrate-binding protein
MKRQHKLLAALVAVGLLAAACGDDDDDTEAGADRDGPAIEIGAQDFGESQILSEIYRQALEGEGFDASITDVGGFRPVLFGAFEAGDVNLAPDYVASELNFLEEGEATSDVDESLDKLRPLLEEQGLVAFEASEAVDTNTFVMLEERADELGIETLSDLAEQGADLSLGAPEDCAENPFCLPGLEEVYGVDLSSGYVPLGLDLIPSTLDEGGVDVGVFLSSSGQLTEDKYRVLEDDQGMLAADNVFPVASQDLVDAYGEDLEDLLNRISEALTTDDLIEVNKRFEIDRDDPDEIAADWLSDNDF